MLTPKYSNSLTIIQSLVCLVSLHGNILKFLLVFLLFRKWLNSATRFLSQSGPNYDSARFSSSRSTKAMAQSVEWWNPAKRSPNIHIFIQKYQYLSPNIHIYLEHLSPKHNRFYLQTSKFISRIKQVFSPNINIYLQNTSGGYIGTYISKTDLLWTLKSVNDEVTGYTLGLRGKASREAHVRT